MSIKTLDKRLNAFRPDIANIALKNKVKAKKFLSAKKHQAAVGITALLSSPDQNSPQMSQLLYG